MLLVIVWLAYPLTLQTVRLDLQRELAASNIQIPIIFITAHGGHPDVPSRR